MSMPTVTKEVVTKYHSRPLGKPTSPDSMAKDSSAAKETEAEKQHSPSQVETQGYKVTSSVADKVKDILTGRAAGKVTAKIMGKKEEATDTKTAQSRLSGEAKYAQDGSGGKDAFVGKKLSSADKATLSNPGIPSIVLDEDGGGRKSRTEFPQPFYSTLGRYKPHEPGDEAFIPITLAMSLDPEEGNRG